MRGHYTLHGPSKKQIIALNSEQSSAEAEGRDPKFQPAGWWSPHSHTRTPRFISRPP